MKKKVISIVLNPFTNDSRVLKENLTLQKAGFEVLVLALWKDGLEENEIQHGIPVKRLKRNAKIQNKTSTIKTETIVTNIEEVKLNLNNQSENKDEVVEKNLGSFFKRNTLGLVKKIYRFLKRNTLGLVKKLYRFIKNNFYKFLKSFLNISLYKLFFQFAKEAKDADIIHCNDLYTLPMGVIVKKYYKKDVKIVYDAHEYETEVNGLKGRKKLFKKIMEKLLIKYADRVLTVSNAIADEYVRLYDIQKPALVLNTPNYKKIEKKNIFREQLGINQNQTIFLYQGALSSGRGIELLLETFKDIEDKNSVIVFMGYGQLEKIILEFSKKHENIYFYPAVSPEVVLDHTCSADFGISMIEDICLSYRYCLPNKMFEYLMAEVPVIVSNLPEMKKLVLDYKVGTVSSQNSINGLKDSIKEAVKLEKVELNNNIQKVKEIYNWEEQEKILLKVYNEL